MLGQFLVKRLGFWFFAWGKFDGDMVVERAFYDPINKPLTGLLSTSRVRGFAVAPDSVVEGKKGGNVSRSHPYKVGEVKGEKKKRRRRKGEG